MPSEPLKGFSIVVPTYDRKRTLEKILEALFAQQQDGIDHEIIVVDDCSTDGTGWFLAGLQPRPGLVVLKNETNLGRARTRNTGARAARYEFILFLDDDIMATSGLLAAHADAHAKRADDGVVVGSIPPWPGNPPTLINRYLDRHHAWCVEEMRRQQQRLPYTFFKTANVSMRQRLFFKAGGFDESFTAYGGEDTELGARLARRGVTMCFSEQAAGHHMHDESVDGFVQKETERGRSLVNYYAITATAPDSRPLFSPFLSPERNARGLALNVLKRAMYSELFRWVTYRTVRSANESASGTVVSFGLRVMLPLLKAQYQWKGCRENRH